jgi:hypothetical protein
MVLPVKFSDSSESRKPVKLAGSLAQRYPTAWMHRCLSQMLMKIFDDNHAAAAWCHNQDASDAHDDDNIAISMWILERL